MQGEFEERFERLRDMAQAGWRREDPDVIVRGVLRPNGMVDLTVISQAFDAWDGLEREGRFWSVFAEASRGDLLYMTYCLLLTPEEAKRFSGDFVEDEAEE